MHGLLRPAHSVAVFTFIATTDDDLLTLVLLISVAVPGILNGLVPHQRKGCPVP